MFALLLLLLPLIMDNKARDYTIAKFQIGSAPIFSTEL